MGDGRGLEGKRATEECEMRDGEAMFEVMGGAGLPFFLLFFPLSPLFPFSLPSPPSISHLPIFLLPFSFPLPPSPSLPLPKSPLPSALCSVPCTLCPLPCVLCPVWDGQEDREREREKGWNEKEYGRLGDGRGQMDEGEGREKEKSREKGIRKKATWDRGWGRRPRKGGNEGGREEGVGRLGHERWDI